MVIKENLIFKYDNIVESKFCDFILYYYQNNHYTDLNDVSKLPWFENNTFYWNFLKNTEIKNEISKCRNAIINLVKESYKKEVYPSTTTLVMWKTGKSMNIHKDNGYEHDNGMLSMRTYTAVMYINDDFEGGETIIMKENSNEIEYLCKPQKGSVLIFKSDESCLHGVKKITKGERLVLSMWFAVDDKFLES